MKKSLLIIVTLLLNISMAQAEPLSVIISPVPLSAKDQASWVGAQKCIPCHEAIYKHWLTTPHAKAWETLKDKNAEQNSTCLRCHSAGFGNSGGFEGIDKTPQLAAVQCESCHGPASYHLGGKTNWSWVKADCPDCQVRRICMECHTPTHSPNFNLSDYLKKIKHPN